jgi:hypothetical protein
MPDFNQFAAQTPYVRPELVSPGLSLIVQPKYDYVNTFPETQTPNVDGNPNAFSIEGPDEGVSRRRRLLGEVSLAPAAETDYNTSKRYNRADLLYNPTRDNEDIYAQNQGFFNSVGHGLGRLVGLTATKTGTGLGYLAGLVGLGNNSEKYGGGFSGWIAGAGDNGIAKWFQEVEDDTIKNDWLPIYKKATEKDHGFFRHMGDLDFWTDDLTDGAAFMASSFIPGMAVSKLKLGGNVMRSLAALRGLQYADEASALARTGVEGTVESQNLLREGLGATVESPDIAGTIKQSATTATQEIPRVIKWIDNAKAIRTIDVGTTSIINTASQAMYSANEAKNNAYETLVNQKDENGQNKYTVDQAKQVAAKVAKDSYLMNVGALSLMNLWEANFLFKKPNVSNALKTAGIETSGLFGEATLAKKAFGDRAFNALKEPAKGFVTGGLWLGNMQLAIDRLNNSPDNFNLDFGDKLKALGKQYVKQTSDAFSGSDTDASKALGVGGFMAAAVGKLLGHNEEKQTKKSLAALNGQVSAFKDMGNIYQTEADGSLKLENGSPVLDEDKMRSWVASMNNVLNLNQLANNFEKRNITEMAKLYRYESFARFAKAHFDQGMGDLLRQKLTDVKNIKPEDLALLGFDAYGRTPEAVSNIHSGLMEATESLEGIYNNIQKNYMPAGIDQHTEAGRKKFFDITDKMFYLTARSNLMDLLHEESVKKYDAVKNTADLYNHNFNSENDAAVDGYNELFEQVEAAKRSSTLVQNQDDYRDELNRRVDYEKNGVAVRNAPSRIENLRRRNPSVSIISPEGSTEETRRAALDEKNQYVTDRQKELDEYVNNNKEVLQRMKKDARGRYLYEIQNKNMLPSVKEMENQQIVQAELKLANNATLNVLSRLADPRYGVKYYDEVYSTELERHAAEHGLYDDLTEDTPADQLAQKQATDEAYNLPKKDKRVFKKTFTEDEINAKFNESIDTGKVSEKEGVSEYLAEKIANGQKLTDEEEALRQLINEDVEKKLQERASKSDLGDLNEELNDTTAQRDALEEKDDRTIEEEKQLQELNDKVDALNEQRETAFENFDNKMKVDNSQNILAEDKPTYSDVLKKIAVSRKRVEKFDDYYMVDGQRYGKVTDLIGDRIPSELRQDPGVQASVAAGNSVDSIVKAYFANQLTDEFKNSMSDKISQEGYDNLVKSLDKIKVQLANKRVEIIGSNVYVIDDALKTAGEIDLLGVDKDGNFKLYEIQARRSDVYRQYGKRGLGVKIRDIDAKRLSMYRNMFANQYGIIPDEIAVKFPVEVKYDRTNPQGFIETSKLRDPIRFTPLKNVEVKLKAGEPIRIGSHFDSIDMTKIFLDTFLSDKTAQDKLKFLFRNVKFDDIVKGAKLTVKQAGEEFQKRFESQTKALNKEPGVDFKIKKFRDFRNKDEFGNPKEFDNLYSLVGNTEISLSYEGQPIGYFSPVETLAYKDADGNFKVLDENTDPQTYSQVTGNNLGTYKEFQRVAAAYKKLHTELTGRMLASEGKEVTLANEDLKSLVDLKMSQGELDLVKSRDQRPNLKDLSMPGVKVGGKMVPTVVNLDSNDSVKVLMDKVKKSGGLIKKYQEVDRWANQHLDDIKRAMTNQDGERVTDNVAVIETPSGNYRIISLRGKEGVDLTNEEDFVDGLGDKFTASVNKNVFKGENIMVVPKQTPESINVGLKDHAVVSKVYPTDDIDTLEKYGSNIQHSEINSSEEVVDTFLNNANENLKQDLEDMHLNSREAIMNDFVHGNWDSISDYLDNFTNCK